MVAVMAVPNLEAVREKPSGFTEEEFSSVISILKSSHSSWAQKASLIDVMRGDALAIEIIAEKPFPLELKGVPRTHLVLLQSNYAQWLKLSHKLVEL